MNADGSETRPLIGDGSGSDWDPVWSPDGRRLAFTSDRDGTLQIYTVNGDGTHLRRLTGIRKAFTSNRDRCTIVGTSREDRLVGTKYDDIICGLGGADTIDGGNGSDIIDGGPGPDRLTGGPGEDSLRGGPGNDRLYSQDGKRDDVDGGSGTDSARTDPGDWIRLLEHIL
jgi:Ca2+-binding RTX toxin-like protein